MGLPRAEWIIVGSVDEEDKGTAAIATWERVERIVGHLMQPTEFYPMRVHITQYPKTAELTELGMAQL